LNDAVVLIRRVAQHRVDEVIARVQEHYNRPEPVPDPSTGWTYDREDLAEVFGTDR
jgi:hypothetical protein